jgi:hypothetical protein
MDIPVLHPAFVQKPLSVRPSGMFRGPKLLQAGTVLSGKRMKYTVRDDTAKARAVQIKGSLLDPLPVLDIDGESIRLGRPLRWYEYAWMGIPLLLMAVGGALGGMLGFTAAYSSARIFRSDRAAVVKYVLTGLVTLSAGVVYVVLAAMVQLALA